MTAIGKSFFLLIRFRTGFLEDINLLNFYYKFYGRFNVDMTEKMYTQTFRKDQNVRTLYCVVSMMFSNNIIMRHTSNKVKKAFDLRRLYVCSGF